jgi:hypothetical protein
VLRNYKKQVAINLLIDLLVCLIFHIIGVFPRDTVNNDLLWELDSKTVLVDGYLLDIVTTPDFHSRLSHQMLDDHISHQLSVGVTVLVQSVNCHELNVVNR